MGTISIEQVRVFHNTVRPNILFIKWLKTKQNFFRHQKQYRYCISAGKMTSLPNDLDSMIRNRGLTVRGSFRTIIDQSFYELVYFSRNVIACNRLCITYGF